MSTAVHFGRDVYGSPDANLEELLTQLSEEEVQSLVDEMAADPDDQHLPASVRTAYRCSKTPTGTLNRDSLISHIVEQGMKTNFEEDQVPFEPGKKRGKVFVPKYSQEEMAQIHRQKQVEEAVRLDEDEEAALSEATVNDLMALAEILDTNPQEFIMQAYSDPLRYYQPDPPNDIDPNEAKLKICANHKETKNVNLNNLSGLDPAVLMDIFQGVSQNTHLVRLSAANCNISDSTAAPLLHSLPLNSDLKSLNLESNHLSPDMVANLFDCLSQEDNGIVEIRLADQAQSRMGYRVENLIADAICRNTKLLKVGIRLEFSDVINRIQIHLISNIDLLRQQRLASEQPRPESNSKWKPARTLD